MTHKPPYTAKNASGFALDEYIVCHWGLLGEEFFDRLMMAARPFIKWYYTPYQGPKMPYETDEERTYWSLREELLCYEEKKTLFSFLRDLVKDLSAGINLIRKRDQLLRNGGVAMALHISGQPVVKGKQPEEWAVHLTAVIREIDKIRREIKARRKAS